MVNNWYDDMVPRFSLGDTVIATYSKKTIKGFVHNIQERKHVRYKRKPGKCFFYYLIKKNPKILILEGLLAGLERYIYDSNSPTRDGYYRKVKSCRLLLTEKIDIVNK